MLDLTQHASWDDKKRKEHLPHLLAYPFTLNGYHINGLSKKDNLLKVILDLQNAAKDLQEEKLTDDDDTGIAKKLDEEKGKNAKLVEEINSLRFRLSNDTGTDDLLDTEKEKNAKLVKENNSLKTQLANANTALAKRNTHVDEAALKSHAVDLLQGEFLLKLFRSTIFITPILMSTKQMLTNRVVCPEGNDNFCDRIFAYIFSKLEKPLKTAKDIEIAQNAGRNVYSGGITPHPCNNLRTIRSLWSDEKFATRVLHKLKSKRNSQAAMCRKLFGNVSQNNSSADVIH